MIISNIVALVLLIFFSAFFSCAETAFTSLSLFQRQKLRESGGLGKLTAALAASPYRVFGAILVGNTLANIAAGTLVSFIAIQAWGSQFTGLAGGALTVVILIFGEITPKQFALSHNEGVAKFCAPLTWFFSYALFPIVWFVSLFGRLINKISGGKEKKAFALEALLHMVRMGEAQGDVDSYEKEMVYNVFRMADTPVSAIMTHRKNVFSLSEGDTVGDAIDAILEADYSRIPLYSQNREVIVGVVMQISVYRAAVNGRQGSPLSDFMAPPLFVPASMKVSDLIDVFKVESLNLAVVLDEYGGLAGIVSREDALEEILGELYDENEQKEVKFEAIEGGWRLRGDTPLYKLQEWVGHTPDHDKHVNTIAGFLIEKLDRMPVSNEEITLPEGRFVIEEVEENHIVSIRFHPANLTASTKRVEPSATSEENAT